MNDLSGKVALVTGASSGIGAATAEALANRGAALALVARRKENLREVAKCIRWHGATSAVFPADVTDPQSLEEAVADALGAFGKLDIVVAAAGVGVAAPFSNTLASEYREMVDTNYLGLLYTINAALPALEKSGAGHIVLVSSGTGRFIHPSVVYSGTKHAVSAMAESLRRELAQKMIRVTCIEPGAVRSEFISKMRPDVQESVEKRLEGMDLLESTDVADAILYAVTAPTHVNVSILTIYPTAQA
jgi:NADP-dependent 3-hydroxy acid dehydrogenase YdfG